MKNLFTLFALVAFSFSSAFSQLPPATFEISGRVSDRQQQVVASATVSVLKAADSSLVKTAVAAHNGAFRFIDIPAGQYLVSASAAGYSTIFSKKIDGKSGDSIWLGKLLMEVESADLKEVTVVARKNMIEQKIDRTVINVDAAITNTGTSALEVLEKSPGVQVDKDGNISLKGKQGVQVMIDGRPTYLSGADLANMLRGIASSQLDQIEIMTNPPSKYDAAGNSGIINIKTKKNKVKGFNGNVTLGASQGKYFKTNESLSLNYRNGKFNAFANYSFNRNSNFNQLDIYRRYTEADKEDTRAIFEQTSLMKRLRTSNNLKAGVDYYLNKKTTLGVTLNGFLNPQENNGHNISFLKNPSLVVDSIVESSSRINEYWKNGSINLNLRHTYDSTGRELTADVDAIRYSASNMQDLLNTTYSPTWTKKYEDQLRGDLPIDITIYSGKIDYTRPLKEGKFEAGWKSSYVVTDSKADYTQLIEQSWIPDYNKTNYFQYKENINAAYVNLNRKLSKKLGMQAGLRVENTNYTGLQYHPVKADSAFNHSYNGLFPTLYLSYEADKNNQFAVSAGRRIDRPRYEDLNPFLFFIDRYTYERGNPYLKPQYSNNIEMSHIFKGKLTTTLNYSITKNLFVEVFDQEGEYATLVTQGNIGKRTNAGVSMSAQLKLASWLSTNLYANYNYNTFEGLLNGEYLETSGGNITGNFNNQFTLGKGWSAELSGWYRSKGIEGQIIIQPMGQVSTGLAKQILKDKGSIKLNFRDMFATQYARGNMNFRSTQVRFQSKWDSRVANITFSYRFGKPIKAPQRKERIPEEQNRVKSGN